MVRIHAIVHRNMDINTHTKWHAHDLDHDTITHPNRGATCPNVHSKFDANHYQSYPSIRIIFMARPRDPSITKCLATSFRFSMEIHFHVEKFIVVVVLNRHCSIRNLHHRTQRTHTTTTTSIITTTTKIEYDCGRGRPMK